VVTMRGTRRCSLWSGVRLGEADMGAYRALSRFHYRASTAGAVWKVYAWWWRPVGGGAGIFGKGWSGGGQRGDSGSGEYNADGERVVGVIVYAMPVPNVRLRNQATGGRYTGWSDRGTALRLLNAEVRCISRVVIHPQFRGMGLATELVERTLGQAGTVLVEALAAMGRVNPFFERAGMGRYEGPGSLAGERVRAALEAVGLEAWGGEAGCRGEEGGVWRAVARLGQVERDLLEREMRRFCVGRGRRGRRLASGEFDEAMVDYVVRQALVRPVYYLWRRPW